MSLASFLRRVASLTPGEIHSRLGQGLAKTVDSFAFLHAQDGSQSREELSQAGRFFFTSKEISPRLELIRANVPDFEKNVLERAAQILEHRFSLLGYGPLSYGKDIDWQLDVVNNKRAPSKPWPRIRYLDFNEVGDSKVTWELSRHQFLVTLAKAWLLTGEEHYIRKLEELYYDWQRKNPYPLGINWASSLEVSFRSLSWIWVWQLLATCESAHGIRRHIANALEFNAWYIRRYLSIYFSPNTHLQGEAVALFFIGTLFPSFSRAADWRSLGKRILSEHAATKVLDDGAYFERSTYYHVYALDFFLHTRILAERNGASFSSDYDDVIKRMLEHLGLLCQAGPPPRFGDDDGGRVFDGNRNRDANLLDPLAIGASLYNLDICKQADVQATEEMLWLLGGEGLQTPSHCTTGMSTSIGKSQSGFYILNAGNCSRTQIVLDAGPLGGGSGGHGHADVLSLTLNLDGSPFLVDPGAFLYTGRGTERNDFRATQAHSTVAVDGYSQAETRTAFSWFRWPEVIVETAIVAPEFQFIAASHDGYGRLAPPVRHRRTIFSSHENFWFVLDELISDGPHDYSLSWHLAPGVEVRQQAKNEWIAELEEKKLHILTIANNWASELGSGWFSPAYGIKQPAKTLTLSKAAEGHESIATILWNGIVNVPVRNLTAMEQLPVVPAYQLTQGSNRWMFLFREALLNADLAGWESDARFVYCMMDDNDNPSRVIVIDGSFIRFRGQLLHGSTEKRPYFVWTRRHS